MSSLLCLGRFPNELPKGSGSYDLVLTKTINRVNVPGTKDVNRYGDSVVPLNVQLSPHSTSTQETEMVLVVSHRVDGKKLSDLKNNNNDV